MSYVRAGEAKLCQAQRRSSSSLGLRLDRILFFIPSWAVGLLFCAQACGFLAVLNVKVSIESSEIVHRHVFLKPGCGSNHDVVHKHVGIKRSAGSFVFLRRQESIFAVGCY